MIQGRHDYSGWHRQLGFPSGITFGSRFIQIGDFRLGDADGHHFSISHKNGITIQIFRSDGTLHPGPRHELNLWKTRTSGPPQGITFGDRFIELGLWRLGDVDGAHFVVTQVGGHTPQTYRSDNTLWPGPLDHWNGIYGRYPEYHCGSLQSNFGLCIGMVTGDRFIQIGDWRLADMDGVHFSISSKTGQTARVFRSDGMVLDGPRTDFNAWDRETKSLQNPQIFFGDRFVQLGQWRFGAVDDNQLSLSHSNGITAILYRSDGYTFTSPGNFSTWSRPISSGSGFGDRFLQASVT